MARILRSSLLLISAAFTLVPAWCTPVVTTYTDPSLWLQNVNGITGITFGQWATPGTYALINNGILSVDGVQFVGTATPDRLRVISNTAGTWYNFGTAPQDPSGKTGYLSTDPTIIMPLDVTLPAGITAFGVDLMTVSPSGIPFTITVDGTSYTSALTQGAPTRVFFGFVSSQPIVHISFNTNSSGTTQMIDNFRFGTEDTGSPVPETATMILIGTGLLGIRVMRRKWRG